MMSEGTDATEVVQTCAVLGQHLAQAVSVGDALVRITGLAVDLVDMCDAAGISLAEQGRIVTRGATDASVARADRLQTELGDGPCLTAIREGTAVWVPDLSADERWPEFGRRTAEEGLCCVLAHPLAIGDHVLGAINLYGRQAAAADDEDNVVSVILAVHASLTIDRAEREESLERALETRDVIGRAKGILMMQRDLSDAEAFDVLRTASQQMNVKLRDIARIVAENKDLPEA